MWTVPSFLAGFLFMLAVALTWNAPVMIALRLFRVRVVISKAVVALGFAAVTAYMLWKMEWFDVWRHGVPPASYLLVYYAPYITVIGVTGWFLGGLLGPRLQPSE
jgi:hypothetical protein